MNERWMMEDHGNGTLGLFKPGKRWRRLLRQRWLYQCAGSMLLFWLILILFSSEHPLVQPVQTKTLYWLTAKESDWSSRLEQALETGLWLDSYDRQVLQASTPIAPGSSATATMSLPVSGRFTKEFGWESTGNGQRQFHSGIDIAASANSMIRAVLPGKVVRVTFDQSAGRLIEIDHGNGLIAIYADLGEVLVSQGQQVRQDEVIAKTLTTGQLHFEIRQNGQPANPMEYLKPPPPNV